MFPDAAHRPGAIGIKCNIKIVVVLIKSRIRVDLPEDNGCVHARTRRAVKMRAGGIVVGRRRLRRETHSQAEIEALDVERVARAFSQLMAIA